MRQRDVGCHNRHSCNLFLFVETKMCFSQQLFNFTTERRRRRLTVRHFGRDGFIGFAGLTEPGLVLGKHSKHVVATFEQPRGAVLARRGVDVGQKDEVGALHVSLLDDVASQR